MVSRLLRCDREIDYKGSKVVTCTCDEALQTKLVFGLPDANTTPSSILTVCKCVTVYGKASSSSSILPSVV
jgi:hypothetical protein